jgi:ribosomal subunit interface protein
MRLELSGRHLDITPGHRRMVVSKLKRLERLLNDAAVSAQVVLAEAKVGCRATVTLHARDEKFLHGTGEGENFGQAVTVAVAKLVSQSQTVKGKWQERKRRPARAKRAVATLEPAAAPKRVRTAARPRTRKV